MKCLGIADRHPGHARFNVPTESSSEPCRCLLSQLKKPFA